MNEKNSMQLFSVGARLEGAALSIDGKANISCSYSAVQDFGWTHFCIVPCLVNLFLA